MAERVDALRKVPLFSGLADGALERLSREFKERTFPAGTEVKREGAPGAAFFVIAEGEATVTVGGEERAKLGPGDYFGEMALIEEAPRSATIVADTDLRCFGLTPWEFRPFVERHPEVAWALLQTLSRRLRSAQTAY